MRRDGSGPSAGRALRHACACGVLKTDPDLPDICAVERLIDKVHVRQWVPGIGGLFPLCRLNGRIDDTVRVRHIRHARPFGRGVAPAGPPFEDERVWRRGLQPPCLYDGGAAPIEPVCGLDDGFQSGRGGVIGACGKQQEGGQEDMGLFHANAFAIADARLRRNIRQSTHPPINGQVDRSGKMPRRRGLERAGHPPGWW